MADLIALHSMLVELHGGMITLAAVCILATLFARSRVKTQQTSDNKVTFWPTNSFAARVARYTDPTAYLAVIGAVVGIIVSAIVGFFIWTIDFLASSPLGMSKVMFSVFAIAPLIVFIFIRSKSGENLWKSGSLSALYAGLGILGFIFAVIAGSLGGHMALKGSILDPIYALLGIDPVTFGVTGFGFVIVTASVTLVELVVPLIVFIYLLRKARS
jgi:hypothetical protein